MAHRDPSHLVSRDVREHNMGLVLSVLDEQGPLARAEIATETGLARGAVTTIVNDLIGLGMIRPAGPTERKAGQVGRPLAALEIDGSTSCVLAVQFGLDEFLIEAVDIGGRRLFQEAVGIRTPIGDPEALVDLLADTVRTTSIRLAASGTPVLCLRIVAQAPISTESDAIWIAVNLGWRDVDLGAMLRARLPEFPLGIRIVNDAKMAAYAEWMALRAEHPDLQIEDIVYLKSDTGIGGGVISRGDPLVARNGLAFEPGHQVLLRNGPACQCGQSGCLEMLAGPDVVLDRAGLRPLAVTDGVPTALAELVRRVKNGDANAVAAWTDAVEWIRMSIAGMVIMFQPQAVVIGGYWAELARDLLPESETIHEILDGGGLGHRHAVIGSAIGRFSAVAGALTLARHELFRTARFLQAPDTN